MSELKMESSAKGLLPQICKNHSRAITHICIQTSCKNRLLCLQCNSEHNYKHHKRIYSLNTALDHDEVDSLCQMVEKKYKQFHQSIDDKIEDIITQSKFYKTK